TAAAEDEGAAADAGRGNGRNCRTGRRRRQPEEPDETASGWRSSRPGRRSSSRTAGRSETSRLGTRGTELQRAGGGG
uniref:Uncharacterized protein n=1 Tax=Aegilops tauschii subsp. strangulata TaxID=200361 RepID=A0A453SG45_AEGTS